MPHQRLNLVGDGKAHRRNAKASNRTWEIRPYGIIGGLGKRGHGGIVNPPRNRKGEIGNPSPTASALEFYPNSQALHFNVKAHTTRGNQPWAILHLSLIHI